VRALFGLFGQQVEDDLLEVLREFGAVTARRPGWGVTVADEDRPRVLQVEGRCPGGDLVQHTSQGVEVTALVDLGASYLLR
jgi:hypothetical protein